MATPTLTEPVFDSLPLSRRAWAFRMNSEGWAIQLRNVEANVGDEA